MNELKTVNCEQLMITPLKPIEFCVDGIISTGLFILAGALKIGKSWLALDICLSVAKGAPVLNAKTAKGTALYLCLEDSRIRIQNRLYSLLCRTRHRKPRDRIEIRQRTTQVDIRRNFSEKENKNKIFIEKIFDFMIERKFLLEQLSGDGSDSKNMPL